MSLVTLEMVPVESGPHRVVQEPLTNYCPHSPKTGSLHLSLATSVKVTMVGEKVVLFQITVACARLAPLSRAPSQMDPFFTRVGRSETEKLNHLKSGRDWSEFQTDSNVSFGKGS